ncbi:hypothetical protein DAT39_001633 [Clarias magur]|uniref:Uncharacterized protein n=1 Tax=Clarias magur TaxID=1594786 RepID=A0A8J4XGE5_CLAMG|nr:hypothetical protein DAT39_001633 [Clarias magur]
MLLYLVRCTLPRELPQGGGGLQGMSADGARAPHNPAGADTESMRKAAGAAKNAKNHLFQEDTTARRWRTQGSASHKDQPGRVVASEQTHASLSGRDAWLKWE